MVSLPGLSHYSQTELAIARGISPAFGRYENLLQLKELPAAHRLRHGAWLECALATYFTTAPTADVCTYWSHTADRILREAWRGHGLEGEEAVLAALGKHGAEELNLSSDIDLVVIASSENALAVEKKLRSFQQTLQSSREFGFCFRLDFDLRPGGKMGPLVTTPAQFQDHYWSQGETWERLALVRLRVLMGPPALAGQITDLAKRFSFRKFLDYTLLEDLKSLRSQVHAKGFDRREREIHLKLEVGGIRDIELFVHSLLVLHGGKVTDLQTRSTTEALERLKAKSLLPSADANHLKDIYWRLRHVENLVQSVEDRQTHTLTEPLPDRFGFLAGTAATVDLESLKMDMMAVNKVVSTLLGQINLEQPHLPAENQQTAWLAGLGFAKEAIENVWSQLIQATALSHKNDRDERARQEFLYVFVNELARHQGRGLDRNLGLNILLDFVRATRGKATFFTMLLRSNQLIQDLARLFCLSPYLGSLLASRPELLDHFILQVDEAWSADTEALLIQTAERKLLTEIWAANQFLADGLLPPLFERISANADDTSRATLSHLLAEFQGARMDILALGKWGGRELGLRSDLDFIFVTPEEATEQDFKVARRFISRLTYEVDLRLRPSGQSGPLLISKDRLFHYWQNEAAAWERQAYLRARPITRPMRLPREFLIHRSLTEQDLAELRQIRLKLLRPQSEGSVDLKYQPGGLVDLEFTVQTALLYGGHVCEETSTTGMIEFLGRENQAWKDAGGELIRLYLYLRRTEQTLQLASASKAGQVSTRQPMFVKAAALLGLSEDELVSHLDSLFKRSRELLNPLDPTGLKY